MIRGTLDTVDDPKISVFHKAFEFLKRAEHLEKGIHSIEGEEIYANIMENTTKKLGLGSFESHRRYIDIHYIISGKEVMGLCDVRGLTTTKEYDQKDDYGLYAIPDTYEKITLKAKDFLILFPGEAHMPNCCVDEPNDVKKVVLKFSVQLYEKQ